MVSPKYFPDGIYYCRSNSVYPYLCDYVFTYVRKFQKALRIVDALNPSGTTEEENMNMEITIHTRKTKKMEYKYKDFDPSTWKFYESYHELKKLPNFVKSYSGSTSSDSTIGNKNSLSTHNISRDGGREKKASALDEIIKEKESRKRTREDEKDTKFDSLVSSMTEICSVMKQKSASSIIARTLKIIFNEDTKKKLEDELIKMALDLEV